MNRKHKKTISQALKVRNKFWNLLRETADFLKDEEVIAKRISNNLYEWPDLSEINKDTKEEEIYDTMNKGFKLIQDLVSERRQNNRENIRQKWQQMIQDLNEICANLEFNKKINVLYVVFGVFCIAGGVALAIFTCGGSVLLSIAGVLAFGVEEICIVSLGAASIWAGTKGKNDCNECIDGWASSLHDILDMAKEAGKKIESQIGMMKRDAGACGQYVEDIKDKNGDLLVKNKRRSIKDARDEFESFAKECHAACKAVVNIQKRIVNMEW